MLLTTIANCTESRHYCATATLLLTKISKADTIYNMENLLNIIQIISAILLVITILLQQRGTGIGGAFGGGGAEVYSVKRGAEKIIFTASVVLSVIFIGLGIMRLMLV